MPLETPLTDLPIHAFENRAALDSFYAQNHASLPGFHLKLAKKHTGIPSVTSQEAIEVALCYGWIDGRANAFDADHWLVRYTPRRSKSLWSRKNVETVERLTAEGRMKPVGLTAVETAKADGRWERAYARPSEIVVPHDLQAALEECSEAKAFFNGLGKSDRYAVLWRIETASINARAGRIAAMVEMLAAGQVPGKTASKKRTVESDLDHEQSMPVSRHKNSHVFASKASKASKSLDSAIKSKEQRSASRYALQTSRG